MRPVRLLLPEWFTDLAKASFDELKQVPGVGDDAAGSQALLWNDALVEAASCEVAMADCFTTTMPNLTPCSFTTAP